MDPYHFFSIGHGRRSEESFLGLLKQYGVQYLIDVRSKPFSRFNPQYNQRRLDNFLSAYYIRYVFMGKELGGRPDDPALYDENGKVSYDLIAQTDLYRSGIERLKTAFSKGLPVAIMCSESKPEECHRSRLIGKTLLDEGITVQHIDENGNLKEQSAVIDLLKK